jgi:hypothetical protein
MEKKYSVFDTKYKNHIQWFEFPIQAEKFIEKRLKNSQRYIVITKK